MPATDNNSLHLHPCRGRTACRRWGSGTSGSAAGPHPDTSASADGGGLKPLHTGLWLPLLQALLEPRMGRWQWEGRLQVLLPPLQGQTLLHRLWSCRRLACVEK